jgi:serine/threonine-protein kinase
MSTKIGHFEILSELSKSATSVVYKANDPQTSQTVALKAIKLSVFGDQGAELQKALLEEAGSTKALSHSNLTAVYGAGEIDGQFCAAMEYIQGNSIATMLARKEGFSIWDLLDIGRQMCSGLDHAQAHNIFHYSIEPAKIMCGWDGTVRILGYGVSSVGKFAGQMPGMPLILHYMSPEQVRGETIDARSNLFSVGALLYEMVTEHKAFDGAEAESVRRAVLEGAPVPPKELNPKVHPVLNDLILKALAKDPAGRYQCGRELLDDLEKCKESKPQAAKQSAAPAPSAVVVPAAVKAATQARFTGAPAQAGAAKPVSAVTKPAAAGSAAAPAAAKAASAVSASKVQAPNPVATAPVGVPRVKPAAPAAPRPSASLSTPTVKAAVAVPPVEAPKIAVDPMMAGDAPAQGGGGISFSEMTELPPLKENYTPSFTPAPESAPELQPVPVSSPTMYHDEPEEKPKVQSREVAEKAIKEIKNVPPRLIVYSIAAAAIVILIIAVALVMHVNTLNNDGDTPRPAAAEATPVPAQPAPQAQPVQAQPAPSVAMETAPAAPVEESQPQPTHVATAAMAHGKFAKKRSVPVAGIVVPGQMAIDSSPQGAQVQVDGRSDPAWITPFTLSGLAAGQHSVTVTKAGYSPDNRTVEVASGGKLMVMTRLTLLAATLAVSSTPAGANIYVDGKDTGKLTPAQVAVDKGQHVVLVRKSGYIDETTSALCNLGQTTNFSPTLRALGNVDDIRSVGKVKKLFGGKDTQGMGAVSIKTSPKGAQVAVNQHMLDKNSPVDFMLDPGNYIVDITLTGYAPIHKIITVDKGGKAVIDEVLQHD